MILGRVQNFPQRLCVIFRIFFERFLTKNYLILVTGLQILRSKKFRKNLKFPVFFLSTKLSQLLCWVIFDKSYGLFSHLSAVEAIFGYENCRKSGPLAKKLSNIGH